MRINPLPHISHNIQPAFQGQLVMDDAAADVIDELLHQDRGQTASEWLKDQVENDGHKDTILKITTLDSNKVDISAGLAWYTLPGGFLPYIKEGYGSEFSIEKRTSEGLKLKDTSSSKTITSVGSLASHYKQITDMCIKEEIDAGLRVAA